MILPSDLQDTETSSMGDDGEDDNDNASAEEGTEKVSGEGGLSTHLSRVTLLAGGRVREMSWDPSSSRLAVLFMIEDKIRIEREGEVVIPAEVDDEDGVGDEGKMKGEKRTEMVRGKLQSELVALYCTSFDLRGLMVRPLGYIRGPPPQVLTTSYYFSRLLTTSHSFSLLLTASHCFSLLLTASHCFSLLLAPSHSFSLLAPSHSFSLLLTPSRSFSLPLNPLLRHILTHFLWIFFALIAIIFENDCAIFTTCLIPAVVHCAVRYPCHYAVQARLHQRRPTHSVVEQWQGVLLPSPLPSIHIEPPRVDPCHACRKPHGTKIKKSTDYTTLCHHNHLPVSYFSHYEMQIHKYI